MNGIQGINSYGVEWTPTVQKQTQNATRQAETDSYTHQTATGTGKEKVSRFTAENAKALAEKYDIRNMSRNTYSKLLQELRDGGMISAKEFSIAYSGSGLAEELKSALPFGDCETDFAELLKQNHELCSKNPDKAGEDLETAKTYSHLHEIFQEINIERSKSGGSEPDLTTKFGQMLNRLKQDKSFTESSHRDFWQHPFATQVVKTMILEDEDLQNQISEKMWNVAINNRIREMKNPQISYMTRHTSPIPSRMEYDVKAILLSGNQSATNQVMIEYQNLLARKAQTCGLTETERFLSEDYADLEMRVRGTFEERMEPVLANIEKGFQDAGKEFDREKAYSFYLDTTTFTFKVSGGTEDENALMEQLINWKGTKNTEKYTFDMAMSAFHYHRAPDLKCNPWLTDKLSYRDEVVSQYGVANVPRSYTQKMQKLVGAHERYRLDRSMKTKFGFGIDDLCYKNGKLTGRTEAVSKLVEKAGESFQWEYKSIYFDTLRKYKGTPTFTEAVFTLENGKFSTPY